MPDKSLGTLFLAGSSYLVAKGDLAEAVLRDSEAEAKNVAQQKALRSLGLHRDQSQAQVKVLLQRRGFKPWQCIGTVEGTTCIAARQRGAAEEDITVLFRNVIRRDQDTGGTQVVGRVLSAVGYKPVIDGEEVEEAVTAGPAPF